MVLWIFGRIIRTSNTVVHTFDQKGFQRSTNIAWKERKTRFDDE